MRTFLIFAALTATLVLGPRASAEPLAYAALATARKVVVVDVGLGQVARTLPTAVSPHGVAASADGRLVFVPDLLAEKAIRVLDAETGREVRRIAVEAPVHHLTLAPGGRRLFATLTVAARLVIVELDTWAVRTVEVGGAPDYAIPAPDGRTVYVSNIAESALTVVDAVVAQVRGRIALEAGSGHGAVAADGTRGFLTMSAKGGIAVVDLEAGRQAGMVPTGPDPHGVAIGLGRRLFVSNRGADTVAVIDLARMAVEATIPVAKGPEHVAASPDGRLILVGLPHERAIAVIDAERLEVVRRIPVDGDPHQLAF
jgi:YVTN family beta-propeller protein